MKIPKAILFDLDGVLLDTEPLHGKAWQETASFFGKDLSGDQLKILQGRRREDCAKQVLEWVKKPINLQNILEIHQPISKAFLKNAKPMPGAEELIRWCHRKKLPTALVTSSSSKSIKIKTSPHPWLELFSTKVQGDDPFLLEGKPAPDPYLLGAKKLSVKAKYCWALEDSISGTNSALKAGCKVWVLKNESNKDSNLSTDLNSNPINVYQLDQVLKVLKNLFQ